MSLRVRELVELVAREFESKEFRARDVERHLGVTRPTAVTVIREAIGHGVLKQEGSGARTRYRLVRAP